MKFKPHLLLVFIALITTGCAQTVKHTPLSIEEYQALDFKDAGGTERWWGDIEPPDLEQGLLAEAASLRRQYPKAINATKETAPSRNLLAISGGGANGAFGAGILSGWTQSGQRPELHIVTGSSTGAIIAPFAFLGPKYDPVIKEIYSTLSKDKIYQSQLFSGLVLGSAITDTTSLEKQIEKYVTSDLVQEIAKEHAKNKRLLIVTTHFDAMRPMIWDIGEIATQRGKKAVPLIRKVIKASAAIPVIFPPVPIEWEANGKRFTELHVDGGLRMRQEKRRLNPLSVP